MTILLQWKKIRIAIATIVFSSLLFISLQIPLNANVSTPITGSIRLSICGDGIVEGTEDCEPEYEEIFQCSEIGSYTGETTCDISCDFDMFNCTPVVPPVEEPVDPGEEVDDEDGGSSTPPSTTPPSTIDVIIDDISTYIRHLLIPEAYRLFDINKDGILTAEEFTIAIRTWVISWREFNVQFPVVSGKDTCDLNGDKICNVVDLSILLYYSE